MSRPGKIVGRTRHTPMMATVLATVIAVQYVLLASIVYNAVKGFASSAQYFAEDRRRRQVARRILLML